MDKFTAQLLRLCLELQAPCLISIQDFYERGRVSKTSDRLILGLQEHKPVEISLESFDLQ